jgi:hypothetical protein
VGIGLLSATTVTFSCLDYPTWVVFELSFVSLLVTSLVSLLVTITSVAFDVSFSAEMTVTLAVVVLAISGT